MSSPSESRGLTCLVIGPIGDKDAAPNSPERLRFEDAIQVYEEVVLPACLTFGLQAVRADEIANPGEIPEQVFRHLRDDYLVIADLTGANPNVMYELGLRHTTGRLTIQIGERGHLPFDVSAVRTILFRRTEAGLVEARKKLEQAIAAGLDSGGDPVTATRIWFERPVPSDTPKEPVTAMKPEGTEEPGFLERMVEMMDGLRSNTQVVEAIGNLTREIGQIAERVGERVDRINQTGGEFGAKLELANRLAALLEEPASRLEVLVGQYQQELQRINPGMLDLLKRIREEGEDTEAVRSFRENATMAINASFEALQSMERLRETLLSVGELSKALRRVNGRLASSFQQVVASSAIYEQWKELL